MANKRRKSRSKSPLLLEGGEASLTVRRVYPSDLIALFSDQFIVSHTENEFVLSFLQTQHPLAVTVEEFKEVRLVDARCVARIILTPSQAERVLAALQQNVARGPKKREVKSNGSPSK